MKSVFVKVFRELSFPEYRARHIFTAKLRLAVFIGFWFFYVLLLKGHLAETRPVTVAVLFSFILTTIGHYNIFNNRYLIISFVIEIIADLIALTAIIYLTGGIRSPYFIIYVFYALVAGLFYNYRLALVVSILSIVFYGSFLILFVFGIIPPLFHELVFVPPIFIDSVFLRLLMLVIFLALAIYATKIAHYFTQLRERMLVERNKELLALQQMSSTIRTLTSLNDVLLQVVNGVLKGLDFSVCILLMRDEERGGMKCVLPEHYSSIGMVEEILGIRLSDIHFPPEAVNDNAALMQVLRGRIIFRRRVTEICHGVKPKIEEKRFDKLQDELSVEKVVAIPLITSRETIGALIGFTADKFIDSKKVNTFQAFADQASLAIEAAMLISELKNKNIELVEANRVKSEFLATMSHELRTPLTAIIGFSELLLEGVMGKLSEDQEDSLKEILNNGNNLLGMINNLLDLSKVDSGKMELNRHSFNWREMITRVKRSLSPLIQKKKQKLTIKIDENIPPVFADEKRIQQVMLNLLSNSIKFTPDKGEIIIKSEFFENYTQLSKNNLPDYLKGHLDIDKKKFDKGAVFCSVSDTGIGISKDDLPHIFDYFHQVDSSSTRSYEGTGLGLALVKQFVELHHGFVWVESEENQGTCFSFVIPVT